MQGEVANFHSDYQNLLLDLHVYKRNLSWKTDLPFHPIGMRAQDQYDALGQWFLHVAVPNCEYKVQHCLTTLFVIVAQSSAHMLMLHVPM